MSRKILWIGLLVAVFINGYIFSQVTEYQVDKVHSNIGFSVTHMVISDVEGNFKDYTASLKLDEQDITNSSVETEINASSIFTDNEKRDNHLRSNDFLNVSTHPNIVFKSNRIEKSNDGYVAHGDLTIRGVTKEVALPFTLKGPITDPYGNKRIGVKANLMINRFDYNVKWDKTLDTGGLVVGEDVNILINAEFVAPQ
ncbi:polyisoprenoid-binding protein [Candidatus Saccharibacteria bacterium]|nr:polyisoprenoid-binding protein [Candidatus Saccharibacteria bacterium]NIW79407.1 polyisoprenoid-binding protein [Calditrichia bacterium]